MLEFELPYPPSINHYWRRVGPRTLISREGRRFRERVLAILASHRVEPLVGPLAVEVEIYPPDNRRRPLTQGDKKKRPAKLSARPECLLLRERLS